MVAPGRLAAFGLGHRRPGFRMKEARRADAKEHRKMFELLPESHDRTLAIKVSGLLTDADYQIFAPALERWFAAVRPTRILLDWLDLEGWDTQATENSFYFRVTHRVGLERVAIVGDKRWEEEAAKLAEILSNSEVRLFHPADRDAAWQWLEAA
jgi:hypothetical protein